jgi:hypothetical protein
MNKLKHHPSSSFTRKLADWLRLSKSFELHTSLTQPWLFIEQLKIQQSEYKMTQVIHNVRNRFELYFGYYDRPLYRPPDVYIQAEFEAIENMEMGEIRGKVYPSVTSALVASTATFFWMFLLRPGPSVNASFIENFFFGAVILMFVVTIRGWLQVFKDRRQILQLLSNAVKSAECNLQATPPGDTNNFNIGN